MSQDAQITEEHFVRLLSASQSKIYTYIVRLVPNISDADDLMQETSAAMWQQRHKYQPDTNFTGWGIRIAYFKILDYRKSLKKDTRIVFTDEVFEQLANAAEDDKDKNNDYFLVLHKCLNKLSEQDGMIIDMKYVKGLSVNNIAEVLNMNARKIYYCLSRIHNLLLTCVERG